MEDRALQDSLAERQEQCRLFLGCLYQLASGNPTGMVRQDLLRGNLHFDDKTFIAVRGYCSTRGYARTMAFIGTGSFVSITDKGIVFLEDSHAPPAQPATQINNKIDIASMVGSSIQQGTTASTLIHHSEIAQADFEAMGLFAREVLGALDSLQLPQDDRSAAQASATAIESQLKLKKPVTGILKAGFESLAVILAKGAASEIGTRLLHEAQRLAVLLHHLPHL